MQHLLLSLTSGHGRRTTSFFPIPVLGLPRLVLFSFTLLWDIPDPSTGMEKKVSGEMQEDKYKIMPVVLPRFPD